MPFRPILEDQFSCLHDTFCGDVPSTFSVCCACGGPCEYTKVTSLMPGEAEYIASRRGEPVEVFRDRYLDGVFIDGEVVDLLKCSVCPFLHPGDYSCGLRGYKPLICLIYPLYIAERESGPEIALDHVCPLAQNGETAAFFKGDGFPLVRTLDIDPDWARRVMLIDAYDYDYARLTEVRTVGLERYNCYDLDTFLSCRIDSCLVP